MTFMVACLGRFDVSIVAIMDICAAAGQTLGAAYEPANGLVPTSRRGQCPDSPNNNGIWLNQNAQ
jgi:hypothetical protein